VEESVPLPDLSTFTLDPVQEAPQTALSLEGILVDDAKGLEPLESVSRPAEGSTERGGSVGVETAFDPTVTLSVDEHIHPVG
jgi:hypothetical protein